MIIKVCSKCGEDKPHAEFHKDPSSKQGVRSRCKACDRIARANNPNLPESRRKSRLKHTFGLSLEQFQTMWDHQEGKCAICGDHVSMGKGQHAIDHNHETGKVRGILCANCNIALGKLKDSPGVLKKALAYLEERGHYGSI